MSKSVQQVLDVVAKLLAREIRTAKIEVGTGSHEGRVCFVATSSPSGAARLVAYLRAAGFVVLDERYWAEDGEGMVWFDRKEEVL